MNSVSVDAAAGVARVSATFREAVVAHRGAAEDVQAFRCVLRGVGWLCVWGRRRQPASPQQALVLAVCVPHRCCCTSHSPCSMQPRFLPVLPSVVARRSEYSVDYELAKEGRDWVITAAAVKY